VWREQGTWKEGPRAPTSLNVRLLPPAPTSTLVAPHYVHSSRRQASRQAAEALLTGGCISQRRLILFRLAKRLQHPFLDCGDYAEAIHHTVQMALRSIRRFGLPVSVSCPFERRSALLISCQSIQPLKNKLRNIFFVIKLKRGTNKSGGVLLFTFAFVLDYLRPLPLITPRVECWQPGSPACELAKTAEKEQEEAHAFRAPADYAIAM
jgi:hypothetical protein